MRSFGTVVAVLLIIPLAGSIVGTDTRHRTRTKTSSGPDSGTQKEIERVLREASGLASTGRAWAALPLFETAMEQARVAGEPVLAAKGLQGKAVCLLMGQRYDESVRLALEARDLYQKLDDRAGLSGIEGHLGTLYAQLGDDGAAEDALRRGLEAARSSQSRHLPGLEIELAALEGRRGRIGEALALLRDSIWEGERTGQIYIAALGLDRATRLLAGAGRLAEAERTALEAYRIRRLQHLPNLLMSHRILGELRLQGGDAPGAVSLLERAVEELRRTPSAAPAWEFLAARGRAREALGRSQEALDDYRTAIEFACNRRALLPAADSLRVGFEGAIDNIFVRFSELAARVSLHEQDRGLAVESWERLEQNRAVSLEATRLSGDAWQSRLSGDYWEVARQLQEAERAQVAEGDPHPGRTMAGMRRILLEREVAAGRSQPISRDRLLHHVQTRLGPDEILLSLHAGSPDSYLWAVGADSFQLQRLPDMTELAPRIRRLRVALETGSPQADDWGRELYLALFGGLDPALAKRRRWILSMDGVFFDAPLAALVVSPAGRGLEYLMEQHTLTTVPGAALLVAAHGPASPDGAERYIGVGDPVYNTADERWRRPWRFWQEGVADDQQLPRLAGSAAEIRSCAGAWRGPVEVVEGAEVTPDRVREAASRRSSVLHLATHVVEGRRTMPEAWVALGLGRGAAGQFITPAMVGRWKVGAELVVMSGCASGAAAALPGTGLMGLTRAWLMAGARRVVGSHWAVSDDTGELFQRFYERIGPREADGAEALRLAQLAMRRSGTWRASPRYWAAFYTVGI